MSPVPDASVGFSKSMRKVLWSVVADRVASDRAALLQPSSTAKLHNAGDFALGARRRPMLARLAEGRTRSAPRAIPI
jgi:hypothetical protein